MIVNVRRAQVLVALAQNCSRMQQLRDVLVRLMIVFSQNNALRADHHRVEKARCVDSVVLHLHGRVRAVQRRGAESH